MGIIRRASNTVAAAGAALILGAAPAMAHDCTNSSKRMGAGSVADLYVIAYVENGVVVDEDVRMGDDVKVNPRGKPAGGFLTIHALVSIDGGDAFEFLTKDVYVHNDLPDPARLGGPGGGACDGYGVDDLETCFDLAVDELMGA